MLDINSIRAASAEFTPMDKKPCLTAGKMPTSLVETGSKHQNCSICRDMSVLCQFCIAQEADVCPRLLGVTCGTWATK